MTASNYRRNDGMYTSIHHGIPFIFNPILNMWVITLDIGQYLGLCGCIRPPKLNLLCRPNKNKGCETIVDNDTWTLQLLIFTKGRTTWLT